MKVLITMELDCELDHTDAKAEERSAALLHLGQHVAGSADLSYSKVERATIGVITGMNKDGVALVAEPITVIEPAPVEAEPVSGDEEPIEL